MSNEKISEKLRLFGRFPKTKFDFDSKEFEEKYMNIISSDPAIDDILKRLVLRYGNAEPKKMAILEFARQFEIDKSQVEDIFRLFDCDKNIISSIGQDIEISIRLFIQKKQYESAGKNELMIDEFNFTQRTFNYILKRGYTTKSATIEALKNGYITNDKVKKEIIEKLLPQKVSEIEVLEK